MAHQALASSLQDALDANKTGLLDIAEVVHVLARLGVREEDVAALLETSGSKRGTAIDYVDFFEWIFLPSEPARAPEFSGIPLRELQKLVNENRAWLETQTWNTRVRAQQRPTMYDLVPQIIKPRTKSRRCSYSELLEAMAAHVFVSHWWGEEFVNFVQALNRYATVHQRSADSDSDCENLFALPEDLVFWICSFANRQWTVDLGTSLEQSPFERALGASICKTVLMVVDQAVTPLRRIWCLYEVLRAHALDKTFHVGTEHGVLTYGTEEPHDELRADLHRLSEKVMLLDASCAQASRDLDRSRILQAIEEQVGLEQFTVHVKALLAKSFTKRGGAAMGVENQKLSLKLRIIQQHHKAMVSFSGRTALHVAAQRGSLERVQHCLQEDQAGINCRTGLGQTPLHLAAGFSNCDSVLHALLDAAADAEAVDRNGFTPFMFAALNGQAHSLEVLHSAMGDQVFIHDDLNEAHDQPPKSPLLLAALSGHMHCVQFMLDRGVQVDAAALSILSFSCEEASALELLLQTRADPNAQLHRDLPPGLPPPLAVAANVGRIDCMEVLLNCSANVNQKVTAGAKQTYPFIMATAAGHAAAAALLLEHFADPGTKMEPSGDSALMMACGGGHMQCIELLLSLRADVNERNEVEGYSPLHNAANWGRDAVVSLLVQKRADVLARDFKHQTPLHKAAMFGYCSTLRALLDLGACLIDEDNKGRTAAELAWAKDEPDAARWLEAASMA